MALYAYKNFTPKVHPSAFIAPTAQIIGNVDIGKNASIWFQTVIRGDLDKIRIGKETNIQDLCICHADETIPLEIGNNVTVGHRSVIHGCTIEDGCLIGMGAIVMNQAVIGKGSVVAAGAVVLEKTDIPPYSLVTGSPGKVKKTYQDIKKIEQDIKFMSETYMKSAQSFGSTQVFYQIKD